MIYCELYGLPGAGKTTVASPVIKSLISKGYRIATLKDVYFRHCFRKFKGFLFLEIVLSFCNYPVYWHVWRFSRSCSEIAYNKKYVLRAIILIHQILKVCSRNKYDMVFCEEGIIQYLSSFSFVSSIPNSSLLIENISLIKKRINIIPIKCKLDVKESMLRVGSRHYGQSRRYSKSLGMSTLETVLLVKESNLNIISSNFTDGIVLDMKDPIIRNQELLSHYLQGLLCNKPFFQA